MIQILGGSTWVGKLEPNLTTKAFVCSTVCGTTITIGDFVETFAERSEIPKAMSPFTAPDYDEILDPATLLKLLDKD